MAAVDVQSPAEVTPLRQYKPHYKDEETIKAELGKLGKKIAEGSRELEGTKLAQLTVLAADYVELVMRKTNDRSSIKEREIRAFIKTSIGYGDDQGRVKAEERSSTIEALLSVSAKAAFLFHHAFNGCDIRHFVGTEVVKDGTKGAQPRLSMPFNAWLPRFRRVGGTEMIDNTDSSYKPLPGWAINAQYTLMTDKLAVMDKDTGRVTRQNAAARPSQFQQAVSAIEAAVKDGNVREYAIVAAAQVLSAALRANAPSLKTNKSEEAISTLYMLLDGWAEQKDQPKAVSKRA